MVLEEIVQPLVKWYRDNKRILPWRDKDNAYYTVGVGDYVAANQSGGSETLISEIYHRTPGYSVTGGMS